MVDFESHSWLDTKRRRSCIEGGHEEDWTGTNEAFDSALVLAR